MKFVELQPRLINAILGAFPGPPDLLWASRRYFSLGLLCLCRRRRRACVYNPYKIRRRSDGKTDTKRFHSAQFSNRSLRGRDFNPTRKWPHAEYAIYQKTKYSWLAFATKYSARMRPAQNEFDILFEHNQKALTATCLRKKGVFWRKCLWWSWARLFF